MEIIVKSGDMYGGFDSLQFAPPGETMVHRRGRKTDPLKEVVFNGSKRALPALLAQVIQTEIQNLFYMLVGKGIEHILPFATELDEVR